MHCHSLYIFDRYEDGMTVRGVTLFNSKAQLSKSYIFTLHSNETTAMKSNPKLRNAYIKH